MTRRRKIEKVAIIYHYLALYRQPIFQELMKSEMCEYTLFSGLTSEIRIEKVEPSLATQDLKQGGLRWKFLKNKWWINKKLLWQRGLVKQVLKNEYDSYIFLGSPYHLSTWVAAIIARLQRKKVYFWMHGISNTKIGIKDAFNLFVFYRIANGFFLYGNRAKKIALENKIKSPKDIHVIYNSLNYDKSFAKRKEIKEDEIKAYRRSYFEDASLPTIVCIGRLNKVKRIDLLLNVAVEFKQREHNSLFNLILIGDGEEKENLISQIQGFHLEQHVYFCGAIYEEDAIAEILSLADLCVIPGEIGLTAIHSLSYGTPVISHNNFDIQGPEVEAIVPSISGDLYNYGDIADLASVIECWLKENPIKTNKIRLNCYTSIDQYYNPHYQRELLDAVLGNKGNK